MFLMSVAALFKRLNEMRSRYSMRYMSKQMSRVTALLRFRTFLLGMNRFVTFVVLKMAWRISVIVTLFA